MTTPGIVEKTQGILRLFETQLKKQDSQIKTMAQRLEVLEADMLKKPTFKYGDYVQIKDEWGDDSHLNTYKVVSPSTLRRSKKWCDVPTHPYSRTESVIHRDREEVISCIRVDDDLSEYFGDGEVLDFSVEDVKKLEKIK